MTCVTVTMASSIIANALAFLIACIQSSSGVAEDCKCWVSTDLRRPCDAGAFLPEDTCKSFGCCSKYLDLDDMLTNGPDSPRNTQTSPTCFKPLERCHSLPQCRIDPTKRRVCPRLHWTTGSRLCQFRGCCYDKTQPPYCFRAQSDYEYGGGRSYVTTVIPLRTPFGQATDIKMLAQQLGNPVKSLIEVMREQMDNYEDNVAFKETVAVMPGGHKVLVKCAFDSQAVPCGRRALTKVECVNMLCCWNPSLTTGVLSGSCVQPLITRFPDELDMETLPPDLLQRNRPFRDELPEVYNQPEDEYIPYSSLGTFLKTCKTAYRKPCHANVKNMNECEQNSCCWDASLISGGVDVACYSPLVSYQPGAMRPGPNAEAGGEWIPFDPMMNAGSEYTDFDYKNRKLTSATPTNEFVYGAFSVMLTCANETPKIGNNSCSARGHSRQLCLSLFCCWVKNPTEATTEMCGMPAVEFVKKPDFQGLQLPGEYPTDAVAKADFWRPSLPESSLFKDELVITIFCPNETSESRACGNGDILTREECVNRGCCWKPWQVLESDGGSPCHAPSIRTQNIADVNAENSDEVSQDAQWDDWKNWTDCKPIKPCSNEGRQYRTRDCRTSAGDIVDRLAAADDATMCIGAAFEARQCHEFKGCEVTYWSTWSPWTVCSESCQSGSSVRIRTCLPPEGCATSSGSRKPETEVDRRVCNSEMCEEWGPWISNEDCDAECNSNGTATRFRLCKKFAHEEGRFTITEKIMILKMSASAQKLHALASSQPESYVVHARECLSQVIPCTNDALCLYEWGPWSEWTDCDSECSPGKRSHSRRCLWLSPDREPREVASSFCAVDSGLEFEEEVCGAERCTEWRDWEQTTPCIAGCGESGFLIKERTCADENVRLDAQSKSCFKIREPCNGPPCPNYVWGDWGRWSGGCSSHCTPGSQVRVRRCMDQANNFEASQVFCDGSNTDTRECNVEFCRVWGNWTEEACEAKCGSRGVKRSRRICLSDDYTEQVTKKSELSLPEHMPIDCYITTRNCLRRCVVAWGEWGAWSPCSSSCSPGKRTRSRECMSEDGTKTNVRSCSQDEDGSIQSQKCNHGFCKEWEQWQNGKCMGDCGKMGSMTLNRICVGHDLDWLLEIYTDKYVGCFEEKKPCKPKCARWGGWSDFSECSDPCSPGKKIRRRRCVRGDEDVPVSECRPYQGTIVEQKDCNIFLCTSYSKWKNDFFCIGSCKDDNVVKNRTRECYSGIAPPECLSGTIRCRPRCGPAWGPWGSWSPCYDKCGPGIRTRSRDCLNGDEILDPQICIQNVTIGGKAVDEEKCNANFCSHWSDWQESICPAKCNKMGIMRRKRTCLTNTKVEVPQDCWDDLFTCKGKCYSSWGQWTSWTACSSTCGPGRQTSVRRCSQNGQVVAPRECEKKGKPQTVRMRSCHAMMCNSWSRWVVGKCAVLCGGSGIAIRRRKCVGSGYISPPDNPDETACYKREEVCGTDPCPSQYEPWSEWTECSNKCSPGVQRRTRGCISQGRKKRDCSSLGPAVQTKPCNKDMCTKWGAWVFFTPCSRNCGAKGTRLKRRPCLSKRLSEDQVQQTHPQSCYRSQVSCQSEKC